MDTRRQAVAYARVSSDRQDGDLKNSLDTQLDGIYFYCQERGYQIVGDEMYKGRTAYTDVISGKTIDRRGLWEALNRLPPGGVLVVYDVDRLAREDAAFTLIVDTLYEVGAGLEAVLGGDLQTPGGELLFGLKRVLSKHENAQRVERFMRAKHEHSKRGFFVAGKAPYGYDYLPRKDWRSGESNLMINPTQAENVRRMFNMCVEGYSLHEIVDALRAEHVTTRTGQRWQRSTVRYVLRNTAYIGRATFGKIAYNRRNGRVKKTYHDTWTIVPCPAIVDRVTFDNAQRILDISRTGRRTEPKRLYMLRGMLVCGDCGRAYTGSSNGHVATYVHKHKLSEPPCINSAISGPKIERQVWAFVVDKLRDPDTILTALGATDGVIEASHKKRENLLHKYERQLSALKQERVNLTRKLSRGVIAEDVYQLTIAELEGEIEDREAMRDHVQREMAAAPSPQEVASVTRRIGTILAVLDGRRVELSPDERRAVMLELNQALDLVYVRFPDGRIIAKGRNSELSQGVLLSTSPGRTACPAPGRARRRRAGRL